MAQFDHDGEPERSSTVQYLIAIYETPDDFARRNGDDDYWVAWRGYAEALSEAGVLVGGNALKAPSTGTTIRIERDRQVVQDGPFADTHEQFGGYFVIEVDTLDAALRWAARAPSASTGAVEVRPILSM